MATAWHGAGVHLVKICQALHVHGARDQSCWLINPPAVNFCPVKGHDNPSPPCGLSYEYGLSVTILRRQWRIFIKQIGIFALAAVTTVTSPAAKNRSEQQIILYQLNADLHQPPPATNHPPGSLIPDLILLNILIGNLTCLVVKSHGSKLDFSSVINKLCLCGMLKPPCKLWRGCGAWSALSITSPAACWPPAVYFE